MQTARSARKGMDRSHPAIDTIAHLCVFCKCQEHASEIPFRQIGIAFPSCALAAPVQTIALSRVGHAYKRGCATRPKHALFGSLGTFGLRPRAGFESGLTPRLQKTGKPERPQVLRSGEKEQEQKQRTVRTAGRGIV